MPHSVNDSSVPASTRVDELLDRTVARFPDRLACIDHDGRRVSYDALGDDGALFLVGRCKEIGICGGINVHPAEIEAALNRHPGVAGSAAVGWPEPDGDEQIVAFVVQAGAETIDEPGLRASLGDKLASFKLPSRIVIVDSLPSAASGKVLKHKLLDTFADRL